MISTGHNPDILTCLANLSADEVFTPPKLASAMLDILPQDLFHRPDTKFLDPVCKSGIFLREIALRLNDGLKDQMPDQQARINHILTKQVFGLAITELTSLLSRRSVYCSKDLMWKRLASTICFGHENLPSINGVHILANVSSLHVPDGAFALVDQVKCDLSAPLAIVPVGEVRRDAEWCVARHEFNH